MTIQMNTPNELSQTSYRLVTASILIGFILTAISGMEICTSACVKEHEYRMFGYSFELMGFATFSLLLICHLLSHKNPLFSTLTGWVLCGAAGAEALFIYYQKFVIGAWCPICLSIAACVFLAGGIYFSNFLKNFYSTNIQTKEQKMNIFYKSFVGVAAFICGLTIAFSGIAKFDSLHAEEKAVKNNIAFGNLSSNIEIFIFTDWKCPACKSLEPIFETITSEASKKAKITFIDYPVHDATLNFTPYNVSFMINNKPKYFALRNALHELAEKTDTPNDKQINEITQKLGVKYQQINYADVALANGNFKELIKRFSLEGTPTVVVYNKETKIKKAFTGGEEITQEKVMKAVDELSQATHPKQLTPASKVNKT